MKTEVTIAIKFIGGTWCIMAVETDDDGRLWPRYTHKTYVFDFWKTSKTGRYFYREVLSDET